jgi:hypothetical protein
MNNKIKGNQLILLLGMMLVPSLLSAKSILVSFTNVTQDQRHEVVEVNGKDLFRHLGEKDGVSVVVRNQRGDEITSQMTYDGNLLMDVSVRPLSQSTYQISVGQPTTYRRWVYGRLVPERKDDITWENDRGIYRIYGPALEATGEKSFGTDVWVKNTPYFVIDERYAAKNLNYHVDYGSGYDPYDVGPTLGCGAPALLVNGELKMPYCWKTYQILDNGPLRFTVQANYGNAHRIISLDKGSNFNRMVVWYDKLPAKTSLAAGVVIHTADTTSVLLGKDYVQYADPTDHRDVNNSQVYVAALFPDGVDSTVIMRLKQSDGLRYGHALGIRHIKSGEHYTYYFGSAWSRYDVRTQREWALRIDEFLCALKHPLRLSFLK